MSWIRALNQLGFDMETGVPLAPFTTMGVGGPAEALVKVRGWEDVQRLLGWCAEQAVPLTWLGKGSNALVSDAGVRGVTVVLERVCDVVEIQGESVYAEAGAALGTVARAARDKGLKGLAFFGGIPGSVGGALAMNAGAYGHETYGQLTDLWLLDARGVEHHWGADDVREKLRWGYRHVELPAGWMFKAARWQLAVGDKEEIRQAMRQINDSRRTSQPLHMKSSGSWFRNPVLLTDSALGKAGEKVNAWKVVDAAGCRGMRVGGAQVSEMHSNFFVNTGGATARDFMALDALVREKVREMFGVEIVREVRLVGAW